MKKLLFLVVMSTMAIGSQEREQLEMTSPVDFIDFEALEQSVEAWREYVAMDLNKHEQEVVTQFVRLGSLFSLVDLQARRMVRELLPLVWQLHEGITTGQKGLALLHEIEERAEKLHQLVVQHDMLLEEWQRWTNTLQVLENPRILNALDEIEEQIRSAIEDCLGAGEWQYIAGLLPEVIEDNARAGNLLNNLCTVEVVDEEEAEASDESVESDVIEHTVFYKEPEVALDSPVVYFSWITNAVDLFNTRSWESIESTSQLLRYREELLTISGVIFNRYLRALGQARNCQLNAD